MKRIILILLIFVALISCEKEHNVEFYMVNIQTNGSFITMDYSQTDFNVTDSTSYAGINYMIRYRNDEKCYLTIQSDDSLFVNITQGRDTILIQEGFSKITINRKI